MKTRVVHYMGLAGCLLVGLLLAGQVLVKRSFEKHWEENSVLLLTNLYRCWTNDGMPTEYQVEKYHLSHSAVLRGIRDTNTYFVENRPMVGLFSCEYRADGRLVHFVVTREGVVLKQKANLSFERLSK